MPTRKREPSLYDVLEINADARPEEIEDAYIRLSDYLGPDALAFYSMLEEEELGALRSRVEYAYRTLSDPQRRATYDQTLASAAPGAAQEATAQAAVEEAQEAEGDRARQQELVHEAVLATQQTRQEESAEPFAQLLHGGVRPDFFISEEADHRGLGGSAAAPQQPMTMSGEEAPKTARGDTMLAAGEFVAKSQAPRRRRLVPSSGMELKEEAEVSGALLRRLRESAGASLQEVSDLTKIGKHYLRALEENDFPALPAAVYVRGFVTEYARVLGLDAKLVARSYLSLYQRYRQEHNK